MHFRSITPDDKPHVLQISEDIWEGDDYIHEIFDEWVSDPFGYFVGLFDEDHLLAFARFNYLTPTDVWFEGLRKDSKTEIHGIAKMFLDHFILILKEKKDITSIRFSTYFENHASIISSERAGFRKILTCSLKNLNIEKTNERENNRFITQEISYNDFEGYIKNSQYLKKSNHLLTKGWIFHTPNTQFYSEFYTKSQFLVYRKDHIEGLILFSKVHYSSSFWITLLEASEPDMLDALLNEAINIARAQNKKVLQILVPEIPQLKEWTNRKGFSSWDRDNDVMVFELPIDLIR